MSSPSNSSHSSLRRSRRERRPAHTVYDDAAELISSVEKSSEKKNKRKQLDESDSEEENEEEEEEELMELEEVSSSSESEDDEEEEEQSPSSRSAKKESSPKAAAPKRRKIATINKKQQPAAKKHRAAPGKKGTVAAWTSLTKGVLDKDETPDNSILAALLQAGSGASTKGKNSKLEELTRKLIRDHHQNANAMHVRLYNFLFRVCGASTDANMPEDVDLENSTGEEFAEYISAVVKSMEGSDVATEVLWTAAPPSAAVKLQFRNLFQEFFHALGVAAMETTATVSSSSESDDENKEEETGTGAQSSMRFQVEVARNVVTRLIEMAFLQQEDLRAAVVSALYSFATALLHKAVELREKFQTAQRQLSLAKRHKQKRKSEALKIQVDTGKRMIEDLEELVKESVMSIFMKRYKDMCPHIRAASMVALADFAIIRPDIFFDKKYLKYPGWTLYDKEAVVRVAALEAFLRPCQHSTSEHEDVIKAVVDKFCGRWADCTSDIDTGVQERAMELLLYLLRESHMDPVDDEDIWNRINLRALDAETTPEVRRLALLFVIEQLGAFDNVPNTNASDVAKLTEIATWTAHNISSFEIPFDQINFGIAAYIIQSMRECKEHFSLARNFGAMVEALEDSLSSKVSHSGGKKGRVDRTRADAQKRVLLEFLITAVEEEVQLFSPDQVVDPDLRGAEPHGKKRKTASVQEGLTRALLPTLPKLLNSFKSETSLMRRLAELPVYFAPSVCGSSDQKRNFKKLLATWSDCFMEANDEIILQNSCHALSFLATADYARRDDAMAVLQDMLATLRTRLDELIEQKTRNEDKPDESDDEDDESAEKIDVSIGLVLRRLAVLSKRWPLSDLLEEDNDEVEGDIVNKLCESVFKLASHELNIRKPFMEDEEWVVPEIWKIQNKSHEPAAEIVSAALAILLSTAGWAVRKKLVESEALGSGQQIREEPRDGPNPFVAMRERLETVLSLCFEQFTDGDYDITEEHLRFADTVQEEAGRVSGDLRVLFPREWSNAVDPMLRAAALVDDSHLIGGYVRFVHAREDKLREVGGKDEADVWTARKFLVPIARGLLANWATGNRREAATALSHITSSGAEATTIVSAMSKVLKRIKPVRLVEAHMACLRQGFEKWADSEPEEPASDNPTDEEIAAFEAAEKEHDKKFQVLEHQAQRLSASLGVGKITDQNLANALLGFVREGIRFSFSLHEQDEELFLGARLPFLHILSKYLFWVRKNKQQISIIRAQFNQMEEEIRSHPDFHQVLESDVEAINSFRKVGNLGAYVVEDDETVGGRSFAASSRASSRTGSVFRRRASSQGGSVSSVPSKVSTNRSDLSPLPEEKDEDMEDDGKMEAGSPAGNSSLGTNRMFSPLSKADFSTDGGDEESIEDDI